jgi:cell division transport system ATP-binding protein
MSVIEFRQVSKRYDGQATALSGLDLTIARGELIFLAGPSGAGKSTLLKLVAGIERPSTGTVLVNGQDVAGLGAAGLPYLRRKLGLILQQQRLLADRSVLANVMLPLTVCGTSSIEAEKRARAALDRVGLLGSAALGPQSLSGGEQQRVAIARAIVNRPQIILADEPTANLDRASAERVIAALTAFHSAGVTCIISTHDEQILERAARVIRLEHGQMIASGLPQAPQRPDASAASAAPAAAAREGR